MNIVADAVRACIPGSVTFLVLGLGVGLLLLYRPGRAQRWGRRWLTVMAMVYWILSVPIGAEGVAAVLSHWYEPVTAVPQGTRAIVVLDGGTARFRADGRQIMTVNELSAMRALEAARVSRLLPDAWVFVQAGRWDRAPSLGTERAALRDALVAAGVRAKRIVLDSESSNTLEHARTLKPLLERHSVEQFVLVTSPTYLRRAALTFQAHGLRPILTPAPLRSDDRTGSGRTRGRGPTCFG